MEQTISEIISMEIVGEILDGIMEPRNRYTDTPDFNTPQLPVKSFEFFNPKILSRESFEDPNMKMYQVDTERQRNSLACGYNTLYNGKLISDQISHPDEDFYHRLVHNKPAYWHFAVKVNKMLLRNLEKYEDGKAYYPWSEKDILSFCLEREYMSFLIDESKFFHSLPNVSRLLMESGFLGVDEIGNVQSFFDDFKNGDKNMCVFAVGSLNHWFSFIVNRYERNKIEGIVADSVNWLYFGFKSSEEVSSYMMNWIRDKYKDRKQTPELEKKIEQNHVQWTACMLEAVWSCHLILDCCYGKKNFIVECIDTYIFGVLKQYCHAKNDVYMFMDRFADPSQIRHGLFLYFQRFKNYLGQVKNIMVFKEWIDMLMEDLKHVTEKLHKDEFNTPKLIQTTPKNEELMWQMAISKEKKKKETKGEKLNESDLKNRDKMIKLLLEFKQLIDSLEQ